MRTLTFRRPDDWHVHFRDGPVLQAVAGATARAFGRAIVMPNLVPPVTTAAAAVAYRARIRAVLPPESGFVPLMTCYLTDTTDAADLIAGHAAGVFTAAKLYPAHATTNSSHGVTSVEGLTPVFESMAEAGMPLLIHGEVTHGDIFDREKLFIDEVLEPLLHRVPTLRIVLEHVTTREGVAVVQAHRDRMGATITPQHLAYNRNDLLVGGIRPHLYCLPVLKRDIHQRALRAVVAAGDPAFFLGTDSAPHLTHLKENACGCAGVFSAPVAVEAYLEVFAELDALDQFEAFASLNGPRFYRLPANEERVTYGESARPIPQTVAVSPSETVTVLRAGETLRWSRAEAL